MQSLIKKTITHISGLLLLVFASTVTAASPQNSPLPISENFTAEYQLKAGFFTIGNSRRSLKAIDNGLYIFESYSWPAGMLSVFYNGEITERSLWKHENNIVTPVEYTYKDTNKKSKRDVVMSFDWDALNVTNNTNGKPWKQDIEPGTQDKLLYQLSVMMDLAKNHQRKTLEYIVADGGKKIRYYDAEVQGKETIKTPAGKFETIRVYRKDKKRETTFWCAPALDFLPVRIDVKKKDETKVKAFLTKFSGLPKASGAKQPDTNQASLKP